MKKLFLLFKFFLKLIISSYKINSLELKNIFCDKIFIKSNKKNIFKSILMTESVKFNKISNKLNSIIEGNFIIQNKISQKKINVLFVAFSDELYIAEILIKLGYDVNLYFYDLKIKKNNLNKDILKKIKITLIEDDIRNFNKYFSQPFFDFIFTSRAGIERLQYSEFINILNQLSKVLLNEKSFILSHVTNIFFTVRHLRESPTGELKFSKNLENEELDDSNRNYDYLNLYCSKLHNSDDDYLNDIKNYLNMFNKELRNPWLSKLINKPKLLKDDISVISASHTKNYLRLKKLQEVSKTAELFSTYFHLNKNKKFYICSYIKIKKN